MLSLQAASSKGQVLEKKAAKLGAALVVALGSTLGVPAKEFGCDGGAVKRRSSVSGVVPSLTLFAGGKGVRAAAKTARRRGSSSSVSVPFPSLSSASLRDADAMSNLPVAGGDRVYHNHRVLEHVKLDQVLDEMRRRRRGSGRGSGSGDDGRGKSHVR